MCIRDSYDAAARYLKELKASGEEITPKEWQREIDLLTTQKPVSYTHLPRSTIFIAKLVVLAKSILAAQVLLMVFILSLIHIF